MFTNSTKVTLSVKFNYYYAFDGYVDFKIKFKCMSGFTRQNAKFIMPLQEKMSYDNSVDSCDSFGFTSTFLWPRLKITNHLKTEWILEKDLDYRFTLPKMKMNKRSLILWLLTAQAGSELNLIMIKLKQMIDFKVRLNVFYQLLKYY